MGDQRADANAPAHKVDGWQFCESAAAHRCRSRPTPLRRKRETVPETEDSSIVSCRLPRAHARTADRRNKRAFPALCRRRFFRQVPTSGAFGAVPSAARTVHSVAGEHFTSLDGFELETEDGVPGSVWNFGGRLSFLYLSIRPADPGMGSPDGYMQ